MGLLDGAFRFSDDPDDNMAKNRALTMLGAGLLGSRGNFSQALGNAVGGAMQGYDDAMNSAMRRRYIQAQMDENKSQAEWRAAQIAEMQRKAQMDATRQAIRLGVYSGGNPFASALGHQTEQMGTAPKPGYAGPTMAAQGLGEAQQQRGVVPTRQGAMTLAAIDELKSTDMDLLKSFDPQTFAGGNWMRNPLDGSMKYLPKINENMVVGPNGQVSAAPGATQAVADLARAQEGGKAAGALPYAGPTAEATRAGTLRADAQYAPGIAGATTAAQEAARAPYQPGIPGIDPNTGATVSIPLTTWAQANMGGPRPPIVTGQAPADARRRAIVEAGDKEWTTKTFPTIQKEGLEARSTIAQMDAVRSLGLKTGWGTETVAGLGNVLTSMGVAPERLKNLTTGAQVFQMLANDGVLVKQIAQAGPQTESDAARMQATLPQLRNTPEGNELIVSWIKAGAEAKVAKADFFREGYKRITEGKGTIEQLEQAWAESGVSLWNMPSMKRWNTGQYAPVPR